MCFFFCFFFFLCCVVIIVLFSLLLALCCCCCRFGRVDVVVSGDRADVGEVCANGVQIMYMNDSAVLASCFMVVNMNNG